MKKICSLFISFLIIIMLVACSNSTTNLKLVGYSEEIVVGDTINVAELKVEDDSNGDITADSSIDISKVDTSTPGVYAIIVKYKNIEKAFYVTVKEKENVETLINLQVDTTNTKTEFLVGETYNNEGLSLIATYRNSNDDPHTIKYLTDLTGFTINVKDSGGNVLEGSFKNAGSYDVLINKDNVSTSYKINVLEYADTIDKAIDIAITNSNLVAGGESENDEAVSDNGYANTVANYEFGSNLLSITYVYEGDHYVENFYLDKNNNLTGVKVNEDFSEENVSADAFAKPLEVLNDLDKNSMCGLDYVMYSGKEHYYGAENFLKGLYDLAKTNPNNDYEEYIELSTKPNGQKEYVYNFSFGYLQGYSIEFQIYNLNLVTVSFTLGEGNFLKSLDVKTDIYVVSSESNDFTITPKSEPDNMLFYEDENGNVDLDNRPNIPEAYDIEKDCMARLREDHGELFAYSNSYHITQYTGERDAVNKYPDSEIYVSDYKIYDKSGTELVGDFELETTITVDGGESIELTVDDFNSEIAERVDPIYFILDGVNIGSTNVMTDKKNILIHFSTTNNVIRIRGYVYGTYEIDICTTNTKRHITVFCDYQEPKTLTPQIYQDNADVEIAAFIAQNSIECIVGDVIYFNVLPNDLGDPEFVATCDKEGVTIENNPTTNIPRGLKYYVENHRNEHEEMYYSSFTTMIPDTYTITLKSNRNDVSTTLTIKVLPEPDFSENLTGSYNFDVIVIGQEKIKGTITFNIIANNENGIDGEANIVVGEFSETISFNYKNREFRNVGHVDGSNGRIKLSLGSLGEIIIQGAYFAENSQEAKYQFSSTLTRPEV